VKKILFILLILPLDFTLWAQEFPPETETADNGSALSAEATPSEGGAADAPASDAPVTLNWEEFPWTLGISGDYGTNTRDGSAYGYGIAMDRYLFTPRFAAGVRVILHNDANTVTDTEAQVNVRLYAREIPNLRALHFFTQFGFGYAMYREEDRTINSFLMDITGGMRIIPPSGALSRFYIEPSLRVGFPFLASFGLSIGRRFNF
jgi:hypothetical protein